MDLAFSSRLLPPLAFTLILLTAVINHVVYCEALYLRAHLKEPFLGLSMQMGRGFNEEELCLRKHCIRSLRKVAVTRTDIDNPPHTIEVERVYP